MRSERLQTKEKPGRKPFREIKVMTEDAAAVEKMSEEAPLTDRPSDWSLKHFCSPMTARGSDPGIPAMTAKELTLRPLSAYLGSIAVAPSPEEALAAEQARTAAARRLARHDRPNAFAN
jgi:hypothetical protein